MSAIPKLWVCGASAGDPGELVGHVVLSSHYSFQRKASENKEKEAVCCQRLFLPKGGGGVQGDWSCL